VTHTTITIPGLALTGGVSIHWIQLAIGLIFIGLAVVGASRLRRL